MEHNRPHILEIFKRADAHNRAGAAAYAAIQKNGQRLFDRRMERAALAAERAMPGMTGYWSAFKVGHLPESVLVAWVKGDNSGWAIALDEITRRKMLGIMVGE